MIIYVQNVRQITGYLRSVYPAATPVGDCGTTIYSPGVASKNTDSKYYIVQPDILSAGDSRVYM